MRHEGGAAESIMHLPARGSERNTVFIDIIACRSSSCPVQIHGLTPQTAVLPSAQNNTATMAPSQLIL